MPQGHRTERVGDQIRAELSDLLAREVRDPGIGFVTLTRVEVTADLQLARVFFTTLGGAAGRRQASRALERATPFLRRRLGPRLRLRRVPEIAFVFDEAIEQQDRVERLLREWHEEREANPVDTDGAAAPGERPDHDDHSERN